MKNLIMSKVLISIFPHRQTDLDDKRCNTTYVSEWIVGSTNSSQSQCSHYTKNEDDLQISASSSHSQSI